MTFDLVQKSILDFWDWAFKRSPKIARFLFGGFLLLAIAGLVSASVTSLATLLKTALLVLACSLAVAALLVGLWKGKFSYMAEIFTWIAIGLVIAVLALFVSSAFLGLPVRGSVIAARIFDLPEILTSSEKDLDKSLPASNGRWPLQANGPLDVDGDRFNRLEMLAKRPTVSLTPDNPIHGGGVVTVDVLYLKGDAIITDGEDLTIEARKIVSDGGRIRSFGSAAPGTATDPRNGGTVTLVVQERIVGKVAVDLSGKPGVNGLAGAQGQQGPKGAKGDNASSQLFDCGRGAGRGRDGGTGTAGSPGADGIDGGNGGMLIVAGPNPTILQSAIVFTSKRGVPGTGGLGGLGGPGGVGGDGGDENGNCKGNGPNGNSGGTGPTGPSGRNGSPGTNGNSVFRQLSADGTLS